MRNIWLSCANKNGITLFAETLFRALQTDLICCFACSDKAQCWGEQRRSHSVTLPFLPLKVLITTASVFFFFFFFFFIYFFFNSSSMFWNRKIHKKCQIFFSLKGNKNNRMSPATILLRALKVTSKVHLKEISFKSGALHYENLPIQIFKYIEKIHQKQNLKVFR